MTETLDQVLPAVAKAMGAVKRIAKDSRNAEQKYDFASVDDFLALVNPICADAGLVFHMTETSLSEFTRQGRHGDTHWLRMVFTITVYHSSGQSLPPATRSVEVIRSGAQAYGSAQSYVLKQFLRALLLIPTGDKDDVDQNGYGKGAPSNPKNPASGSISQAWRDAVMDGIPDGASQRQIAEAFAEAICADFSGKGARALENRWETHLRMIQKMEIEHPDLHEKVVDAYELRKNEITDDFPQGKTAA